MGKGEKKREREKKKRKSSACFKQVRLVLLVYLSVNQENGRGWLEGLVSLFSLPEPHSSLLSSSSPVPQGPSAPPMPLVHQLCFP